jgi:muramoyltetrapeptide carboxypeptidase
VVAPSGSVPPRDLWPGLAWLRTRYDVRLNPGVLSREGYLAGTDERRRAELAAAMVDPHAKAVFAARGGYGAMRALHELPWDAFAARPKWLVGFSDITVLHVLAWGRGVASVHGPNVSGLGLKASPALRAAWLSALERPTATRVWRGLRTLRAGRARGPVVGGNLSLLYAMAAAGRLVVPDGAVIAMEDVNEAPYRVDRMLTALRVGGYFDRASALVFGDFDRAQPGPDGWTTEDVLGSFSRSLGLPAVAGAPFGHGARNESFILGGLAEVSGDMVLLG